MTLKTHHKVMIGSFSALVLIYIVASSLFMYLMFTKITLLEQTTNNQLLEIRTDTQSKLKDVSETLLSKVEQNEKETQLQIEQLKATTRTDFSEVIDQVLPSVVTIRTDISQGTGFIITEDGYIVTNDHVIDGGKYTEAITSDQNVLKAELIGFSSDLDVAVLKIPGTYTPLLLGNSEDITLGEKVIAIGNPLGLQFSASEGIVSAVHRISPGNSGSFTQTDAALNPGNSGGPLINKQAEAIGINNFKVGGYEGLGFALESNQIKSIFNKIFEESNIGITI